MAEEANGNPNPEPNTDAEANGTDWEAQYKGIQRTLERERKRNAAGVKTEELQATIDLMRQEFSGLTQAVSAIADEDTVALLQNLRAKADEAYAEIQEDTRNIQEIHELEAENDLFIEEVPEAAAHMENGNFEKAKEVIQREAANRPDPHAAERAAAEAARVVDTGVPGAVNKKPDDWNTLQGLQDIYTRAEAEGDTETVRQVLTATTNLQR